MCPDKARVARCSHLRIYVYSGTFFHVRVSHEIRTSYGYLLYHITYHRHVYQHHMYIALFFCESNFLWKHDQLYHRKFTWVKFSQKGSCVVWEHSLAAGTAAGRGRVNPPDLDSCGITWNTALTCHQFIGWYPWRGFTSPLVALGWLVFMIFGFFNSNLKILTSIIINC